MAPAPQGNGFDTGVMVSLRQDRIVARVSYFTTDVTDQSGAMGVNNAFSPRYDQILSILDDPNGDGRTTDRLYTSAQMAKYSELRPTSLANGDSLDNANIGVEFRVTANVSESLRFIVNYSYNLQERANVYKRTTLQTDQLDAFVADLDPHHRGSTRQPKATHVRPVLESLHPSHRAMTEESDE